MSHRHLQALATALVAVLLFVEVSDARPRIAFLTLAGQQDDLPLIAGFADGLRQVGYEDGRNLDIDYRFAEGNVTLLKPLAQELVGRKPDVLLASEPSAARAFKAIAPTLPIVCTALGDAVIPELAASYARPLGSVTGIAQNVEGVVGKLVEVVLEIVPDAVQIGFLSNPTGFSMRLFAQQITTGARARGITIVTEDAATEAGLAPAISRLENQGARAVIVPLNGLFRTHRARIAKLALDARLPTVAGERRYTEAGGLASYGVDEAEIYGRAAVYIDRILKGSKPGELPIEFPTKLELVVNLKTAKALGLNLPFQLQQRADEVIE